MTRGYSGVTLLGATVARQRSAILFFDDVIVGKGKSLVNGNSLVFLEFAWYFPLCIDRFCSTDVRSATYR